MSSLMGLLGIDRLSTAEQLQLVDEILASIESTGDSSPLTDAQRRELDRRLALIEADPSAMSSWDEVEARVLGRLRQ